jgi:hypothetical protein
MPYPVLLMQTITGVTIGTTTGTTTTVSLTFNS